MHSKTSITTIIYERKGQSSFFASTSTAKNVELVISKLNCNSGHSDAIPHKIFVKFSHVLSKPISDLFNLSVSTGVFPDILKIAYVIPIYKSGYKIPLKNYRTISILFAISKIFEKHMCNRLNSYIENNNILSSTQFGFRKVTIRRNY